MPACPSGFSGCGCWGRGAHWPWGRRGGRSNLDGRGSGGGCILRTSLGPTPPVDSGATTLDLDVVEVDMFGLGLGLHRLPEVLGSSVVVCELRLGLKRLFCFQGRSFRGRRDLLLVLNSQKGGCACDPRPRPSEVCERFALGAVALGAAPAARMLWGQPGRTSSAGRRRTHATLAGGPEVRPGWASAPAALTRGSPLPPVALA